MILVDTSIWIELLNGRLGRNFPPDKLLRFAICTPILQEILQGVRDPDVHEVLLESLLALPLLGDPIGADLYIEAANIYRAGRRRGSTIRSSVDCLIAAVAIRYGVPVWHKDRDFETISKFTTLESVRRFP